MSEAERKRWWRYVAIAVVGGGLAIGGWVKFMRPATAEPVAKLTAAVDDQPYPDRGTWSRSSRQVNQSAVQPPGDVILAAGTLPQIPALPGASGPVVPGVVPGIPNLIPPPADFGTTGPHDLDAGLMGTGTPLTALPPIPGSEGIQPTNPTPNPTIPSISPQPIGPPAGFGIPPAPPVPALPAIPGPTTSMNNQVTQGVPVNSSGIAPPLDLAPVTPPIQFPDTIQPVMPVRPDFGLQGGNGGITVKTENPPLSGGSVPSFPGMQPTIPVQSVGQTAIPLPGGNAGQSPIPVVGIPSAPPITVPDRPKPVEGLLLHSEKDAFSLPTQIPHDPNTPGDNIMLKRHQQAAALALLGGMFLAPAMPVHAVDPPKDDITALKGQIEEANKKLEAIQKDLKQLTETLNGKKDEKGAPLLADQSVLGQIISLREKLEKIDKDLTAFKNQTSSSSLRPQIPVNPIVDPRAGKGMVRVVNDYPVQISMVINGISHKIPPSMALDFDVQAGEFSYQLLESGAAPTKSYIKEK
ncbi:MAG TPA: hypothetical protein VG122_20045, partial [Gemmata sp.]|nr:hypothetical protein [Gemmata sp.]